VEDVRDPHTYNTHAVVPSFNCTSNVDEESSIDCGRNKGVCYMNEVAVQLDDTSSKQVDSVQGMATPPY
jgi:hypothetical protein